MYLNTGLDNPRLSISGIVHGSVPRNTCWKQYHNTILTRLRLLLVQPNVGYFVSWPAQVTLRTLFAGHWVKKSWGVEDRENGPLSRWGTWIESCYTSFELFPQYFLPWKTGQARLREMKHVPLKILKISLEHPAPSLSFPVYRVNGRCTHPCEPDPHPPLRKGVTWENAKICDQNPPPLRPFLRRCPQTWTSHRPTSFPELHVPRQRCFEHVVASAPTTFWGRLSQGRSRRPGEERVKRLVHPERSSAAVGREGATAGPRPIATPLGRHAAAGRMASVPCPCGKGVGDRHLSLPLPHLSPSSSFLFPKGRSLSPAADPKRGLQVPVPRVSLPPPHPRPAPRSRPGLLSSSDPGFLRCVKSPRARRGDGTWEPEVPPALDGYHCPTHCLYGIIPTPSISTWTQLAQRLVTRGPIIYNQILMEQEAQA